MTYMREKDGEVKEGGKSFEIMFMFIYKDKTRPDKTRPDKTIDDRR